ncbi:uncharacterized protein METZ01_LOCUS499113 [marine metagenome]|uniref:Sel1 repeat family protein n=1 Tax=marine metagenome TaxID=408172 RepID=A0A383DPL5_9ZZZZ
MKKLALTICLTLAVLLGGTGTSWGTDYEKGLAAANSGDFETALREMKPLAEMGHAGAQYNLGVMYNNGFGVSQDNKRAAGWYTLAAEQGHAEAQFNLGQMYRQGFGVSQDYKRAAGWFSLAAEQGDANAQFGLGLMYANGKEGVIKDYVYAHMWLNIVASNGSERAGELRDLVAKRMSPAEISAAQDLARECIRKKYKGC